MLIVIIYAAAGLLLLWLGIAFYIRSVASRKVYRCPSCGESFRVELMDAGHCNTCGATLKTGDAP